MQSLEIECPREIASAITIIHQAWHTHQSRNECPFDNRGAGCFYNFGVFVVRAYNWGKEDPYNFRWRDVLIRWYKYAGRSMYVSREMTDKEIAEMITECLAALDQAPLDESAITW